ncbi:uncharacterized protein LY79DRAFT_558303 [Colletotrichum navitas]|uniref:Uncharacterized protein n=1 Tax=Colletotrichum navitas TaxID=681940 RepID=A0AAD8PWI1_9PEZI|nr:uncharacterized protein LY79DRAFT_558303 [Colletotrichum navitas]KAK1585538.1 hypothetical protein LY79DRAFT_558303 [Colletotrichum navitas]
MLKPRTRIFTVATLPVLSLFKNGELGTACPRVGNGYAAATYDSSRRYVEDGTYLRYLTELSTGAR